MPIFLLFAWISGRRSYVTLALLTRAINSAWSFLCDEDSLGGGSLFGKQPNQGTGQINRDSPFVAKSTNLQFLWNKSHYPQHIQTSSNHAHTTHTLTGPWDDEEFSAFSFASLSSWERVRDSLALDSMARFFLRPGKKLNSCSFTTSSELTATHYTDTAQPNGRQAFLPYLKKIVQGRRNCNDGRPFDTLKLNPNWSKLFWHI